MRRCVQHFHRVVSWHGEPHPRESQALSWQLATEMMVSPMLPANAPVLKALLLPTSLGITRAWETGVDVAEATSPRARARIKAGASQGESLEPAARKIFAAQVMRDASAVGGIVLINSDIELATSIGGSHLPSGTLMAAKSRPDVEWCSASCHDIVETGKGARFGVGLRALGPDSVHSRPRYLSRNGWNKFEIWFGTIPCRHSLLVECGLQSR